VPEPVDIVGPAMVSEVLHRFIDDLCICFGFSFSNSVLRDYQTYIATSILRILEDAVEFI
jgi:hypothetical protein